MKRIVPALFLTVLMSSCATLFTGSRQRIVFDSDVPQTRVIIDGIERGETPVRVRVKRGYQDKIVEFEKPGYERKTFILRTEFNNVAFLNLLGPFIGWGVDAVTGALMRYDQQFYRVKMDSDAPEKAERVD